MRKRSFLTALIVFLVLVAAVFAMRRQSGGLMQWMSAVHGR